ncbi:MAG: cytochrome c [Lentimicrobium sp.]|nr:cytochrome c [Lentimicrobium sp.]
MKHLNFLLIAGVLAASILQSCSKDDPKSPDEIAFENATVAKGGILYDKFWSTESGYDQNDPNYATINAKADFFRCKQCHGWDGLGAGGSYINRGPKTTRPNVNALNIYQIAQSKTAKELFDAMKSTTGRRDISYDLSTYDPATNATEGDKMPNFNQLLSDDQIWDLVKFMKEGMFDVNQLYDVTYTGTYPSGSFAISNVGRDGDETKGKAFYDAQCKLCHGADGKTIALGGKSAGDFTRSKAYEVQHKVKYGQLGSSMVGEFDITLAEMKDLYKALANETIFPD